MGYNVHWGTIAPGQTLFVGYTLNGGEDQGAQFAEGSPEDPGGVLFSQGYFKWRSDDGSTTAYGFTLSNQGAVATNYMLEGGGLT